jgi:hypothetical protein
MANPVVHSIAENGGDDEADEDGGEVEDIGATERADGKKEGVTGQEGSHDEACFREDNEKKDDVNPEAVLGDEVFEVIVNVEDDIDELLEQLHAGGLITNGGAMAR